MLISFSYTVDIVSNNFVDLPEINDVTHYQVNLGISSGKMLRTYFLPEQLDLVHTHIQNLTPQFRSKLQLCHEAARQVNLEQMSSIYWENKSNSYLGSARTTLCYIRHLEALARKHNPSYVSSINPQEMEY